MPDHPRADLTVRSKQILAPPMQSTGDALVNAALAFPRTMCEALKAMALEQHQLA
jgi:hypothetical protein